MRWNWLQFTFLSLKSLCRLVYPQIIVLCICCGSFQQTDYASRRIILREKKNSLQGVSFLIMALMHVKSACMSVFQLKEHKSERNVSFLLQEMLVFSWSTRKKGEKNRQGLTTQEDQAQVKAIRAGTTISGSERRRKRNTTEQHNRKKLHKTNWRIWWLIRCYKEAIGTLKAGNLSCVLENKVNSNTMSSLSL